MNEDNSILNKSNSKSKTNENPNELTDQEKKQVEELKRIDREVRNHEQAHLSAGGGIVVSGPTYQYQRGPDGKQYAVGGEVQIDAAPIPDDPEKTIIKMQQVRAAALAPAEPSAQDRKVANEASRNQANARMQIMKENISSPDYNQNPLEIYSKNQFENIIDYSI